MKATLAGIGGFLSLALWAAPAEACSHCYACSPVFNWPLGVAPSPCNMPGFYSWCPNGACYGVWSGPNYYVRPPFPPFGGILPGPTGKAISDGRCVSYPGSQAMGPPGMAPPGMAPPGMAPPGMAPPGMATQGPYGPVPGPGFGPGPFRPPPGFGHGVSLPPHCATPYGGGPTNGQGQTVVFPTHPYVRSPRDFFMWRENMEERAARDARPSLIP